jgi:hypothetical protein
MKLPPVLSVKQKRGKASSAIVLSTALVLLAFDGEVNTIRDCMTAFYEQVLEAPRRFSLEQLDITDDGCGLVSNQYSSQWIPFTESENQDVEKLQQCLQRTVPGTWPGAIGAHGYHGVNPSAFRGQLKCNIPVSFDVVRSALSQYETVWMHGDSIMAQTFYTLSCMMDSNLPEWDGNKLVDILKTTGLGYNGPEQFTFVHSSGSTKFIYSRFGKMWGLDKNLYEDDFPMAVKTLTSRDAIVTNGAAVHNHEDTSKFDQDVHFINEQSKMTNATVFFLEPTPQEWPTSNGMFIMGMQGRCNCYSLTQAQLHGIGNNYTCGVPEQSKREPDFDLFNRIYPNLNPISYVGIGPNECIPNCVPNYWRSDVVRRGIDKSARNVHLVPIYWQLVSRLGGSAKGDGDCTHRDLIGTMTMLFQWTRTILELQKDH